MAALPAIVNLDAYRGDTWSQAFRFSSGGVAEDLSAATVASKARARVGAPSAEYDLPVTVTDAADGQVAIGLPAESIPAGDYDYDVEVANGKVTTWVRGRLRVHRDVTNELP